ncbi:ester cyclase, partial [Jannaschia rubra]
RVLSEAGAEDMRNLGTLMAANDVLPSRIVASQWCRNQQTVEALLEGFDRVDPEIAATMPVASDAELNLLLSLQGARSTAALRDLISAWDGDPERSGPLLLVSHYTNIEELTQFRVFEGEVLVLDPGRDNQVLGYLRLRSAEPDVGHFADALASPLLDRSRALDMLDRYYVALDTGDEDLLADILSDQWVIHGGSPSQPDRDSAGFLDALSGLAQGLTDRTLSVDDVYLADDVVTVRGTITGRHTGPLYGIPATGREVTFGHMGVHRIANGKIVESWQMPDRATLMDQITREE